MKRGRKKEEVKEEPSAILGYGAILFLLARLLFLKFPRGKKYRNTLGFYQYETWTLLKKLRAVDW